MQMAGTDNGMVGDQRLLDGLGVAGHQRTAGGRRLMVQLRILADLRTVAGDGVIEQPAEALLREIVFGFHIAAQITGLHIGAELPQRPDAVQPRVLRVGNAGDFILFHHLRTAGLLAGHGKSMRLPQMHIENAAVHGNVPLFKAFAKAVTVLAGKVLRQAGQLVTLQRLGQLHRGTAAELALMVLHRDHGAGNLGF